MNKILETIKKDETLYCFPFIFGILGMFQHINNETPWGMTIAVVLITVIYIIKRNADHDKNAEGEKDE